MNEVLTKSDGYLTTRQIFEEIKQRYDDVSVLDKSQERKYMANLSARLTKGFSDGVIDKIKEDGKEAVYGKKQGSLMTAR